MSSHPCEKRSIGVPPRALMAAVAALLVPWGAADAEAQVGTLTGEVREAGSGRALVNAQVYIVGTSTGGLTNQSGRYLFTHAPGTVTLRVELIGYAAQSREVTVTAGQTTIQNFELRQSTLQLDEVVVTGAGVATERRKLGNTIATIDASELVQAPVMNISEILTGREPGVIGLPSGGVAGEGARIRIRGSASLSQSNEPVIYVDGIRVDGSGGFGPGVGAGGGGTPSRLDDINPDAIERIEILKGAAAATLYGTQASNGVIQIFTKRGQSGAPRYDLQIEQGFSRYPMEKFVPWAGFVLAEGPSPRPHGTDIGTRGVQERWGLTVRPFEVFEIDRYSDIFGTGHLQTYSLSVNGGSSAATYFLSGRFHQEDGPFDGKQLEAPGFKLAQDKNSRMQFNANIETFPLDNLRVRVSSNYIEANQEVPNNHNNIFGVFPSFLMARPELSRPNNPYGQAAFATTRENFHRLTTDEVQRYGGAIFASYQPAPRISLDATVGIDFVNQRSVSFIPFGWNVDGFTGSNVLGTRTVGDRNRREVTLDVKGTWSTSFLNDFTSELVVGAQGFLTRVKSSRATGSEFPGPGLEVAGAGALQTVFEGFLEEVNAGVLAQNQFGFRNYLFLTLGGRYDKHSAFGETAGGAFYPKASLSVIPSDTRGWTSETVSTLRFRSAIGASGLQPGAFDKFTTFSPLAAATGPGLAPANLGNPDLKPETSVEWEVGSEVGLFQDRASLDVTYWNRTVTDVLVDRQFAPSGGFRLRQLDNIGELKASGVEIGVNAVVATTPSFSLNAFASASYLKERITDLGGAPALKVGGSYPRYRQFTMEGYHPGSFFGAKLDTSVEYPIDIGGCQPRTRQELLNFFSVPRNPSVVNPIVVDCGTGNMLLQYLGKPVPDWQGSFGTTLNFLRNFRLNTLFEYRFGEFYIHDLDSAFRRSNPTIGRNIRKAAETEAILLNPASTPEQRLEAALVWVRELKGLSPYDGLGEIHEADWLRLRELSLTWFVPAELSSRIGARSMALNVAGRNLAIWTKYPGLDPEMNQVSRGQGGGLEQNFGDGTSAFGLPLPRRVSFSVRVGF